MAETFAARKTKLLAVQALVTEMIELNNRGLRLETEMLAAGLSTAEIGNTIDKIFDGAGPSTAVAEATADTISDRVINLNNGAISGAVDWSYSPTV